MKKKAIVVQNLKKKFEDVTAVDGLSLEIEEGELFGLLGLNGAGSHYQWLILRYQSA